MSIEGLRPRLNSAVVDYRLKLKMHESACEIAITEKNSLFCEAAHRSRRGARYQWFGGPQSLKVRTKAAEPDSNNEPKELSSSLPTTLRTKEHLDRYSLRYRFPIR
jgi:hypothetical protein